MNAVWPCGILVNGGGGEITKKGKFLLWPEKRRHLCETSFRIAFSLPRDTLNNETSVTSNSFSKFDIGTQRNFLIYYASAWNASSLV